MCFFSAYWSTVVHADRTTMKQTSPKRPGGETPSSLVVYKPTCLPPLTPVPMI